MEVARQSLVLLKNTDDLLPLDKGVRSIAVIGPNADDELVLRGNYFGDPSESTTVLQGIRTLVSPKTTVSYARGCGIIEPGQEGFAEAVDLAAGADVAVVVLGLSQEVEGEESQTEGLSGGMHSPGDRADLALPGEQEALLQAVAATGTPVGAGAVERQRGGDKLGG